MSDYTPTTEEVREAIAEWTWSRRMFRPELAQSDGREFDRWCAEWEAEQGETLTGEIRGLAFEDGEPHGIYCGLDDCGCPDHDNPPRPAGTYITVRLDGDPPVGLWRVQVRRIPVPDTTNNESEGKA